MVGSDVAFICKVIVTHYISNSSADNGATIISAVPPKKHLPFQKKKKRLQDYIKNVSQKERRESNSTRGYAGDVRTDNAV